MGLIGNSLTLDVGSGSARYGTPQSNSMERGDICIDLERPLVIPKAFMIADGHKLPFKSECFDKIFCYDVIEHVDSPKLLSKEMFRVLKFNGAVELSTPNPYHWRRMLRVLMGRDIIASFNSDHIACWSMEEMKNLLRESGYSSIQIGYDYLLASKLGNKKHAFSDSIVWHLPAHWKKIGGWNLIAKATKKREVPEEASCKYT